MCLECAALASTVTFFLIVLLHSITVSYCLALTWSQGEKVDVVVPVHTSPGDFWCQPTNLADQLLVMSERLAELCEAASVFTEMPPVSTLCCAQFPEDNLWYRTRILSADGKSCKVCAVTLFSS